MKDNYFGQGGFTHMPWPGRIHAHIYTYLFTHLGQGGFLHIQTFSKSVHSHKTCKMHTHTEHTHNYTYYTYTRIHTIHTHARKIDTQTYLGQGRFRGERGRTMCCMGGEGRGSFLLVWGRRLRTVRHRHHRHRGHHHHHRQKSGRGGGQSCTSARFSVFSLFYVFNIHMLFFVFGTRLYRSILLILRYCKCMLGLSS